MATVALLIVLALLFGGVGLLIEGLRFALIIALALLVVGAVAGFRGRGLGFRSGRASTAP